jgi:hypothetical protein
VDSAEADQVGSQRFRFCAYVGLTIDEGVRQYRATPGALSFFLNLLVVASAIADSDSFHSADRYPPAGTSSFRIGGRSATSIEPGLCGLFVLRPAQPTRLGDLIGIHLLSCCVEGTGSAKRVPGCCPLLDRISYFPAFVLFTFGPVQGLVMVPPIDLGDFGVQRHRLLVVRLPLLQWRV